MPKQTDTGPSETHVAERIADFQWRGSGLAPGIGLALSGGGFRAMLFHAGALQRLNELELLRKVDRIASVSGGSLAAGHLAAIWKTMTPSLGGGGFADFKAAYVDTILAFSRRNLDIVNIALGLLPFVSGAKLLADSYAAHLFGNATLRDLPESPTFIFCATNLQSGAVFRFTRAYAGDYVIGRIKDPTIRLAEAVGASSAFPPLLSPLHLRPQPGTVTDWPKDGPEERLVGAAELAKMRSDIILTDGGVYDNHGLEPIEKRCMTVLVSDGGAPFGRSTSVGFDWVRQLKRVLDVEDNQVRALRRRNLIARLKAGRQAFDRGELGPEDVRDDVRLGAYWGIDTDPSDAAPPEALPCATAVTNDLARASTRLADCGELRSKQVVNWGYAICDRAVRSFFRGPPLAPTQANWPFPEAAL